jgi:hypothetical protein
MDTLIPAERHRRPRVPAAATPVPPAESTVGARGWLDTHRATLVAVAVQRAAEGWLSHATRLATILFRHLKVSGHYPEGRAIHSYALHAAQDSGDRGAQADAWRSLGFLDAWQGRYEEAAGQLRQALAAFARPAIWPARPGRSATSGLLTGGRAITSRRPGRSSKPWSFSRRAATRSGKWAR